MSDTERDRALLDRTRDGMFFIVGAGRSGTTLLQSVLMAGDEVTIPMETKFFGAYPSGRVPVGDPSDEGGFDGFLDRVHADQASRGVSVDKERFRALASASERSWGGVLNALLATVSEEAGGRRVGEKSPVHTFHVDALAAAFPNARFVHMVRDPRAVVLSRIRSGFAPRRIEPAVGFWRAAAALHREHAAALGDDRYHVVRYEDLVREPEPIIRGLCAFLGLTFADAMLAHEQNARHPGALDNQQHHQNLRKPISADSLEKWRTRLSRPQIELIEGMLGGEIELFGYERSVEAADAGWVRRHAGRSRLAAKLEAPVLRAMRVVKRGRRGTL